MTKADSQDQVAGVLGMALMPAILANALVLLFAAIAHIVEDSNEELYYKIVQEDGALEWMTFWAFMLAAFGFFYLARQQQRAGEGMPWLTVGLALFSFVVAMEEISWAQRVFGYRPPEYFLKENFQQELNVHNVMSTDFRKFGLKATILGYGVVLPILGLSGGIRKLARRIGPVIPPLALIPAFAVTYWIYEDYPWSFSGEIVEMMLGLGFLFAASLPLAKGLNGPRRLVKALVLAFGLTAVLGFASGAYSHYSAGNDPARVETAKTELEALSRDFMSGRRPISKCGVHKRVFSWVEKYGHAERLANGQFAALTEQGLPETRAEFFIDPWNSPIWIRHKCSRSKRREIAFLYSMGPNRRRDSTDWKLGGDDVGVILRARGIQD